MRFSLFLLCILGMNFCVHAQSAGGDDGGPMETAYCWVNKHKNCVEVYIHLLQSGENLSGNTGECGGCVPDMHHGDRCAKPNDYFGSPFPDVTVPFPESRIKHTNPPSPPVDSSEYGEFFSSKAVSPSKTTVCGVAYPCLEGCQDVIRYIDNVKFSFRACRLDLQVKHRQKLQIRHRYAEGDLCWGVPQ